MKNWLKKCFTIGTHEWKTMLKCSLILGLAVGLVVGVVILLKIL